MTPNPKVKYERGKALSLIGDLLYPEKVASRPQTRGDCATVPRPCPYVGCRHNLYFDLTPAGNLRLNNPGTEPWDMDPKKSCSLDLAEQGGMTLDAVGEALGVTRERARQIESTGLRKLGLTCTDLDESS